MTDVPPRQRRECRCKRARHQHGTKLAYNADGCRCDPCRAAVAVHNRAYYRRRTELHWAGQAFTIEGTGTRRRLHALTALGWTCTELAARLGVSPQAVHQLTHRDRPLRLSTAATIAALYDEISMRRPSPWQWVNARTASKARGRGWLPPLAWDDDAIDDPSSTPCTMREFITDANVLHLDEAPATIDDIAVERAMRGDPVRLTSAERSEAVVRLTNMRYSAREIAARLGLAERTIVRRRSAA